MADPLTGLLSSEDEALVTDFLGRTGPVSTKGQPTLPVGGAPVTGGTGPVSPGGTGVATAPGTTPGGPSRAGTPSDVTGLAKLGVNVAEKLAKLFPGAEPDLTRGDTGGQSLSDVIRSGGALGTVTQPTPEMLGPAGRLGETATGGELGLTFEPSAGAATTATETAAAADAATATGEAATSGVGLAEPGLGGTAIAEAGVAANIAQRAQGKMPAGEQANLAVIEALLATTGPGALAIPLTELTLSGQLGKPGSPIDYATSGAVSLWSDMYGGGRYTPTRKAAFSGATEGLKDFGNALMEGAKSGDPGDALKSLQGTGPVRASVNLPPEAAQQLGITSTEFAAMKPEQFTKLLDWYAEDPGRIQQTVGGSGDVRYLPQRQAQQVADQAAGGAQQLLTFLVNRRIVEQAMRAAQPEAAPAPAPVAAPPVTPAGGGPLGLAEIGLEVGQ